MDRDKNFTFLTWAFLVANLIYGVGFFAFGWFDGVSSSSLYQSLDKVFTWLPEIWGILTTVAVAASIAAHRWSVKSLGTFAAVLGMGTWSFASLVYLQTGYVLVFFSVGMLYLSFWLNFYFKYISDVSLDKLFRQ